MSSLAAELLLLLLLLLLMLLLMAVLTSPVVYFRQLDTIADAVRFSRATVIRYVTPCIELFTCVGLIKCSLV